MADTYQEDTDSGEHDHLLTSRRLVRSQNENSVEEKLDDVANTSESSEWAR